MMNEEKSIPQLKNILYISIPDDINNAIGEFQIDPAILLPVELPPGEEKFYLDNLSWEMILAAILKILAYNPENENAEYYRRFILHVKPDIVDELSYTGIMKANNKDYSLAEEIFLALSNLLPENIESRINLALVYEEQANTYNLTEKDELADMYRKKTISTYNSIFSVDDTLPEAHLNAGYFFSTLESFDKARHHFEMFLEYGKDKKKLEEVTTILQKISEQSKQDQLFREAYDFIKLGKENDGIQKINAFLKYNPDISNAWFLLGWAYRRLGKFKDGKNAFIKALELAEPHCDVLNELAICLMELGEYKESGKRLRDALRLEPENIKVISNLGILALKEDKKEEALGFFHTVLEFDPQDPIAKQYLAVIS